jgi:hypothetical protein
MEGCGTVEELFNVSLKLAMREDQSSGSRFAQFSQRERTVHRTLGVLQNLSGSAGEQKISVTAGNVMQIDFTLFRKQIP